MPRQLKVHHGLPDTAAVRQAQESDATASRQTVGRHRFGPALGVLLTVVLVAGCGGGSSDQTASPPPAEAVTSTQSDAVTTGDGTPSSSASSSSGSSSYSYTDNLGYTFDVSVDDVQPDDSQPPPNFALRASVTVTNTSGRDRTGQFFVDDILVAEVKRSAIAEGSIENSSKTCKGDVCREYLGADDQVLTPPGEAVQLNYLGPEGNILYFPGFLLTPDADVSTDVKIFGCDASADDSKAIDSCSQQLYP